MTEIPDKTKDLLERLAPFITTSGEVLRTIVFSEEAVGVATEALLAAEKRGEERERERWGGRPYSILEPKGGWRSKEQFSEIERRKLLPIAETIALLDGNAFFTLGAENEWAFSYLPEADAIYQANGGDNGWAGEASFAKPFAAAVRKGSD